MNRNLYCQLTNGTMIPKRKVDDALMLFESLKDGFVVREISDEELFTNGNKFDAIKRFHEKHNVGLAEAKAAIEYLRGAELKGE